MGKRAVKARTATSAAAISSSRWKKGRGGDNERSGAGLDREAGFTLLELSLVIVIVGLMLTIVLPRFRDSGHAEMLAQAHRLQQIFRLLRSQSVLNGQPYRLNFDLDQERYWVSPEEGTDLADFARDLGQLSRGTQLPEPVSLLDVDLPTMAGKVSQGQIFTVFYPDGSVDPTAIHLSDGNNALTLWLSGVGRLNVTQGYSEYSWGAG